MRMEVLGSAGSYSDVAAPASGFLFTENVTSLVVDMGPGTFERLAAISDPGGLSAVVITHKHVDHCSDIYALFHYVAYGPGGLVPMPLYAPDGAFEALAALGGDKFRQVFTQRTIGQGDEADVESLHLRFAATDHSVPGVGVRVLGESGAVVYSSDTGPGGGIPDLAHGAKVLMCEATFQGQRPEDGYQLHMTAQEAGELAARSAAGKLILTHIPPSLDPVKSQAEAQAVYTGQVLLAVPGLEIEV